MASGAFVTEEVDLELPTAGFPLVAMRSYESTQPIDGPLGYGWTSGLAARLHYTTYVLALPDIVEKVAYITMPDGARYRFEDNGDGTFTPPAGRHDFLAHNADGSFDLWLQRSFALYHFAEDGSLETMTDEYGNQIVFTYDSNGRLLRVDDASGSGRYLEVYWGADGRISNVVDSAGRQVGYTYDGQGMLTSVVDPLGRTTTYDYVDGKYVPVLSAVRDNWDRVVTTVTYDEQDRVTSYTDQGETYTYTFNYQNNPSLTAKQDSAGNTWVYTHGEGGLVTRDQAPAGASNRYVEYYPDGSIMLQIDEVGVKTFYTYDTEGRVLTVTLDHEGPSAVRLDYAYDSDFPDQVTAIKPRNPADDTLNPHWQAWQYDYYAGGSSAPGALHHVYRVRSDGSTLDTLMTYEYDTRGRPTVATDAAGGRTEYVYDGQGNLVTVRSPSNNDMGIRPETHYAYDALARVTSVTDPMGSVTTYSYDDEGRLLTVRLPPAEPGSPLDFTTSYAYDQFDAATGLIFTEVTDPNGHVTKQGYDQHGRLVEIHDALGAVTRYGYANGHLASITDAHDYATYYAYDPLRRLEQTLFPDGVIESYTYWGDGLLRSKTDRKGQATTYSYDAFKRLQTKTYPDTTSITYTYQGQKLTQVTDTSASPNESHIFLYDDAYRVVSNTQADRGTIDYTYTPTDQVASYTVQNGATTNYTYYQDQTVHTIEWSPVAGQFVYTYTLRAQYDTITFPNGQQRLYSYDDQGRLLQLANVHPSSGSLATYAYGYDANYTTGESTMLGQRTSLVADVPTQGFVNESTRYYYDKAYRLIRADYPPGEPFYGQIHEWAYDLLGNRLTTSVNGVMTASTYQTVAGNPNNWQRLLSEGLNHYSYDANGNTISRSGPNGSHTLTWDSEDRMVRMSGSETAIYGYDFQGRRRTKDFTAGTESQLYDHLDLVAESGSSTAQYIFGPDIDEPLALFSGGQLGYLVVDGLGSVSVVMNEAAQAVNSYVYDAWGTVMSSTAGIPIPFGYAAREVDETELWFMRARYYSPTIGRFLSEDPLEARYRARSRLVNALQGQVASRQEIDSLRAWNPYPYVLNEPIRYTDPLGLDRQGCDGLPDCVMTPRQRDCCHQHDVCYAKHGCTSKSWRRVERMPDPCFACNVIVLACLLGEDTTGDEARGNKPSPWPERARKARGG